MQKKVKAKSEGTEILEFCHFWRILNRWTEKGKYASFEAPEMEGKPVAMGVWASKKRSWRTLILDFSAPEKANF